MTFFLKTAGALVFMLFVGAESAERGQPGLDIDRPSSSFPVEIADMLSVPFGGECHDCTQCSDDPIRHEAAEAGRFVFTSAGSHGLHECSGALSLGDCSSGHVHDPWQCPPNELGEGDSLSMIEVMQLLVEAQPEELKALLDRHRKYVSFNQGRSAIQVFGCEGGVIAHLPLSDFAARSLSGL
jgi:hypothetical protein